MKKTISPSDRFKQNFKKEISKSNTPPFLFAGSGLSIRYYGIPTWIDLLNEFVDSNRECFKNEFGFYSSKCSRDPLKIASQLAEEFHVFWWSNEKFKESRERYKDLAGSNVEVAFKIELAQYIESKKTINNELKGEIELLSKAVLSGILTTNWDDFLQSTFSEFKVNIGQREIIFSDQHSIGDIYKIHGCVSQPESLILTSEDYDRFIQNNHYLNSKILTLFVDYPIVFMGYSLSDPNIELILKNIVNCLDNDFLSIDKLQDRLFFVEWQPNPCDPEIETTTISLKSFPIPIKKIKAHGYKEILEVLAEIPRKFPINVLRQLQGMVYDFVLTAEPTNKILVKGIEDLDKIDNLEVVVGFGNISKLQDKGVVGLKDLDLIRDILFDDLPKENYPEIVEQLLPTIIRKNVFIPFFKYQNQVGNLNQNNSLKDHTFNNHTLTNSQNISIVDYRLKTQIKSMARVLNGIQTLQDLIDSTDFIHAIQRIPYLSEDNIDTNLMREYLIENFDLIEVGTGYFSNLRKCVCLLDYLENANQKSI
jgi:hypothetical protein